MEATKTATLIHNINLQAWYRWIGIHTMKHVHASFDRDICTYIWKQYLKLGNQADPLPTHWQPALLFYPQPQINLLKKEKKKKGFHVLNHCKLKGLKNDRDGTGIQNQGCYN